MPEVLREEPKEIVTVYKWISPSRPFRQRSREVFTTLGAMIVLISLILLFAKEIMLIAVIVSAFFVFYALNTTPPGDVEHKVMTNGIESVGHFYSFGELRDFWFEERYGHKVLYVNTKAKFPGRLVMLMNGENEDKLKEMLLKNLTYREKAEKTWIDNASEWLSKKVPLEKTS